jgi:stage III sporulation protein AB
MRSGMGLLLYTPEEWLKSYRQRSCHSFIRELLEAAGREIERRPSESFPAAWDRAVTECMACHGCACALRAGDVSALRRVGAAAGAGDAGTLIENLAYADEWIDRQRREADEECKRKKGMFLRMGFLLGAAAVIILA